jgi:hypothetical protein
VDEDGDEKLMCTDVKRDWSSEFGMMQKNKKIICIYINVSRSKERNLCRLWLKKVSISNKLSEIKKYTFFDQLKMVLYVNDTIHQVNYGIQSFLISYYRNHPMKILSWS